MPGTQVINDARSTGVATFIHLGQPIDGVIGQERDGSGFNKKQQRPTSFKGEGRLSGGQGDRSRAECGQTWRRSVELCFEERCCYDDVLGRLLSLEES